MLIFSYREKQVTSQKQLDKYLKSSFNGEMFFKFQYKYKAYHISALYRACRKWNEYIEYTKALSLLLRLN